MLTKTEQTGDVIESIKTEQTVPFFKNGTIGRKLNKNGTNVPNVEKRNNTYGILFCIQTEQTFPLFKKGTI